MSTNATLRNNNINNLAKRGSNILCGNLTIKEKEPITKKTIVGISSLNSNLNPNSKPSQKLENKIKVKPKENNENDKNTNNILLKRKLTIECEKKGTFANTSTNLNNEKDQIKIPVKTDEINVNFDMNISMKEFKEDLYNNENTEMNIINPTEDNSNFNNSKISNTLPDNANNSNILSHRNSMPISLPQNLDTNFNIKNILNGEKRKNNNLNVDEFNFNEELKPQYQMKDEINSCRNINNQNKFNNLNLHLQNPTNTNFNTIQNNNISSKINFKTLINGISITSNSNNYSFNLENISISKENIPKFSNEEYRRMFTRLIKKNLGKSFLQNLFSDEEQMDDFLDNHKVTERMRTRMIDWMIEVLTNYKCDDNAFFIAVNTMDRYFKYISDAQIQPNELHLIGVTTMFMASKYEDIYPLRLKIVHEKIAHKKLSTQEIKTKETDISTVLNFIVGKPTQWDFINHFIEEIFFTHVNNYQVTDKVLCEAYVPPKNQGTDHEIEIFKNYNSNMINLLRHVVVYLAKMNSHDYIISSKKPSLIAASTIFVAMKICEQINKEEYVNEYFSKKLTEISQKNENDIIKTAQKILYNAQNFDNIFTGLENLKKIHFNAIIDLKNTK